ncbi:hypothetical protein V8D89_004176 [Ganoderma adspersum]
MLSPDDQRRPLTRSVCATVRALLGDAGDVLHKHRCLMDQSPPAASLVLVCPRSPIARLSNEELLLIFEEALYNVFSNPRMFVYPRKPAVLVVISHVSRRWRGVALMNSCLWTHIISSSLAEVEHHMCRSRARPLTIYGMFPAQQVIAGPSSADHDSAAIAVALTPNAYPMLENLEIILPEYAHLDIMRPNDANNAILFPALKNIALIRVHPMILRNSSMPSLQNLRLEGLIGRVLFSQLFSLLYRSPALRTLILHLTLPTIDLLALSPVSSLPRLFPNGPLRGTRFKLRQLVYLSLNPAPPLNLRLLFLLLDLPALERLDLHIHTDPRIAHWPCVAPDGRTITILPSPPSPNAQIVRLPSLHSLHVTYCIIPSSASAPSSESTPATNAAPTATFPQLRRIVFPAFADLQIAHAFLRDPARAQDSATPPPPHHLHPFDALVHAPDFTHLVRLALARCALPLRALCDALRTRLPALEALVLNACPGAGALVCALAPGECGGEHEHEHEHEHEREHEGERGRGDACAVIEARLRAGASTADAGSETKSMSIPSASSGERVAAAGSKLAAGRGGRPERITQIQVLECAGVTRDDMAALAAIPGAPTLYWSSPETV